MAKPIIKAGFCVAYDWELLKRSLPIVYPHADLICLSVDKDRKSWSGVPYAFDEADFQAWLKLIDTDHKIILHEAVFSDTKNTTIQNDNLQRSSMAEAMGKGGWHIQVDADEYFLDFKGFRDYLLKINPSPQGTEKPVNICANWISLIKKVPAGYLYVKNDPYKYETTPFATNVPEFAHARRNGHFDHISPFFVLHETWARGEEQLRQKLESWGHSDDFTSRLSYFNLWKSLDEHNYQYIRNFHPIAAEVWQELGFAPAAGIDELLQWLNVHPLKTLPAAYYTKRNSRIVQGLRQRLGK